MFALAGGAEAAFFAKVLQLDRPLDRHDARDRPTVSRDSHGVSFLDICQVMAQLGA